MAKKKAIVRSDSEKQIDGLLGRLNLIKKEKSSTAKAKLDEKRKIKAKKEKFIQDKRDAVKKEIKKKKYAKDGMKEKRAREKMRMD